jgi:uncharacterized membrane protein
VKKLFVHLLGAAVLCGWVSFTPLARADCTPLDTSTVAGRFSGQICVDSTTQTVRIEGALAANGRVSKLDATGAILLEKVDGAVLYTISGPTALTGTSLSENPGVTVTASGDSLSLAVTRFAAKVINLNFP